MPIDLTVSAERWCDSMLADPAGPWAEYARETANELAAGERSFVPVDTGATLRSIRVTEHSGADGHIEEHVDSARLTTNVLNSKKGYIDNPVSRIVRRRRISVRPAHPFVREAIWSTFRAG